MPKHRKLIRKREGSPYWHAHFTVKLPDGRTYRLRKCTFAEEETVAQAIALKWHQDILTGAVFDKKPDMILTEALGKYWLEHARHLSSGDTIAYSLRHIERILGKNTPISNLTDPAIHSYVTQRRSELNIHGKPLDNQTVNKELRIMRAMLNMCRDKWRINTGDYTFKQHMLPEPDHRLRWISKEEADRLMGCSPPHLRDAIQCVLLTGMRLGNVRDLKWRDVDLVNREITLKVKSKKPGGKTLVIPIVSELHHLFTQIKSRGKASENGHVFLYKGKKVLSFRKAFNAACERAHIKDFRFHDLRHTAATWLVKSGMPLDMIQDILGHEDIATTRRYAHRQTEDRRIAMEKAFGTDMTRKP